MANKIIWTDNGSVVEEISNNYVSDKLNIVIKGDGNNIYLDKSINFQKSKIYIQACGCYVEFKKNSLDWPVIVNLSIRNGDNQKIEVGENFTSGGTNIEMISPDSCIKIGDDCMFSQNVYLQCGDGHCIFEKGNYSNIINGEANIEIGSHVWAARNTSFTKNASVANDTIVGMGAIVTKSYSEPNVVLGGVPAKIVKTDICWERESIKKFMEDKKLEDNNNIIFEGNKLPVSKFVNSNYRINVQGENNEIVIGKNVVVRKPVAIQIYGNNHRIYIGDNTSINRGLLLVINRSLPNADNNNSEIYIGENCVFNGSNIEMICGEKNTKIHIGKGCLFAKDVQMCTSDSHLIYDTEQNIRINKPGNIEIEDDVWVCQETLVLKNTKVSRGSIIAARSLVNKAFDECNILIGGSPAGVLRKNCEWKYTEEK